MKSVSDFSADDIATNPISDAGSTDDFLFPVSPFLHEEWLRSWTSNVPEDSHTPQVNAERVLVWSSDGGAETSHPENPVTGIYDEGRPVIPLSDSISQTTFPWFFPLLFDVPPKSTLPETENYLAPDSAISTDGRTEINLADVDTYRNHLQEGALTDARLVHRRQYMHPHTTSTPSVPSIPQDISTSPVLQYQGESAPRDRPQKLQKTSNQCEKVSSQSSRRPAGKGGVPEGPYPCDICGKRYAQPQGVGRHYRAKHGHFNSCLYCNFKWSRPYLYRAHLKNKHRLASNDVGSRHRVANAANTPQQQPVLTLTPENGQRGGTETSWCLLTPSQSTAVELPPACPPIMSHVDHDPCSVSVGPSKRRRKCEDASEFGLCTEFLSTELRAQLTKDSDMPTRNVFQDQGQSFCQGGRISVGNPSTLMPHLVPSLVTPVGECSSPAVGVPTDEPWGLT